MRGLQLYFITGAVSANMKKNLLFYFVFFSILPNVIFVGAL